MVFFCFGGGEGLRDERDERGEREVAIRGVVRVIT